MMTIETITRLYLYIVAMITKIKKKKSTSDTIKNVKRRLV